MRQKALDSISKRIQENYANDSRALAPADMVHRASNYCDQDHFEAERDLMRRHPVIIAHSSTLPNAGDFVTDNHLGVPLLISRQADGTLRALLNICSHRGAPVCSEKSGNRKLFVCPYHAWSFRSDGALFKKPDEMFPSVGQEEGRLTELPVEERHGLIWVVATPGAAIDVATHLGPLDDELAQFPLEHFVEERSEVVEEDLNWKYILDGFLETYHIPVLHRDSIAPYIHGKYDLFDQLGLHGRLVVIRKALDGLDIGALGREELLRKLALNYYIFPNTILVWQGDHFEAWTAYPGKTPGQCAVRIMSLTTSEAATDEYRGKWDRNWEILLGTVQREDWAISKEVQARVPLVRNDLVVFGRNEPAMQHFHTMLDKLLSAA